MKRFQIVIVANAGENSVVIHREELSFNILLEPMMFHAIIKKIMPTIDWELDDGDDTTDSNYCQYVCYTEDNNKQNYLLASWYEINEDGTVK